MRLTAYEYHGNDDIDWDIPPIPLKRINLIVGDSGVGKTRFINTISNLCIQVITDKLRFPGEWDIHFVVHQKTYNWNLKVVSTNDSFEVEKDNLFQITPEGEKKEIIIRDRNRFIFLGKELPKLAYTGSSISLLKNEELIDEIFIGFQKVLTRRFFNAELTENFNIRQVPKKQIAELKKNRSVQDLFASNIGFHRKIALLKSFDNQKYERLIQFYTDSFPFIKRFEVLNITQASGGDVEIHIDSPVLCFYENNVDNPIIVNDISSGMQKLFLLGLDIMLMEDGGILIIDEYENSLGINALDNLPDLMLLLNENSQFILSSHHPYIINTIPIDNWLVFNRSGTSLKIKTGDEIKKRYGRSKQEQFIQLINDPFYKEGIE